MKEINIVSPEEYFLDISSLKKEPNFNLINKNIQEINTSAQTKVKRGNSYQHTKTGYREDLDLVLRSNWEANVARILNAYKIKFEFEPTVFAFPIKRRNQRLYSRFFYNKKLFMD